MCGLRLAWVPFMCSLLVLSGMAAALNEKDMGVVVDQTITPIGKRFYQQFAYQRHYLFPNSPFSISIYEQPSARSGSIITVKSDDTTLERFVLSFASNWEDARVQQMVQSIEFRVRRMKVLDTLVGNPDLAKDGY